jgi:hypothetical protein
MLVSEAPYGVSDPTVASQVALLKAVDGSPQICCQKEGHQRSASGRSLNETC